MTSPLKTRRDYGAVDADSIETHGVGVRSMAHLITASEFEDALKESKFEEGKPADPTKNMSPEDAAEWKRQHKENEDNFKSAFLLSAEEVEEALKESKFEEGSSADPTKNMSPEDAAEWKRQNEKHKDNFKAADLLDDLKSVKGDGLDTKAAAKLVSTVTDELAEYLQNLSGFPSKKTIASEAAVAKFAKGWGGEAGASIMTKAFANLSAGRVYWVSVGLNATLTALTVQVKLGNKLKEFGFPAKAGVWNQLRPSLEAVFGKPETSEKKASDDEDETTKEAKFPRGQSMSIDEVAAVVGDEFKEMNENPPDSVVKLREDMQKSASDKEAGSGLYGYTKDAEKTCGAAAGRLAKFAGKLAKDIYTKDAETPAFLEAHNKRTGCKTSRMLRAAMADIGPGAPKEGASKSAEWKGWTEDMPVQVATDDKTHVFDNLAAAKKKFPSLDPKKNTKDFTWATRGEVKGKPAIRFESWGTYESMSKSAGKSSKGRYGFSSKTSKLALDAISQVQHEAGEIAADLNERRAKKHGEITGFFTKHSKKAKCGWSELILDAYPDAPVEEAPVASKKASGVDGYTIHPTVDELLSWDGSGRTRSAASFLASEEDDLDESDLDDEV